MKTWGDAPIVQRWMPIAVDAIRVDESRRPTSAEHVAELRESFRRLGGQLQLQPILVDGDFALIDGAHRLEAAKQACWSHIGAIVFEGATPEQRPLLEVEANRVRRSLTPLELEEVWRTHYEPELKARARQRQLAGLRQGEQRPVLGNSNNRETERVSISRVAKRVTGLSIDTLNKITEIRSTAASESAPEETRAFARRALRQLEQGRESVDALHRTLRTRLQQGDELQQDPERLRARELERVLERAVSETTLFAEQILRERGDQLEEAARLSPANREHLRAIRIALARSLATVVSRECRLETEPIAALRAIGAEVGKLLSSTSVSQLKAQ